MIGYHHRDRHWEAAGAAGVDPCTVRVAEERDTPHVKRLALEGLLPGHVQSDLSELDQIGARFLTSERGNFWVAEVDGRVIGTLGLAQLSRDVGHLRWLRVLPPLQGDHRVARCLVRVAGEYAREMGFLKLVFQAPPDAEQRVIGYFHLLGFEFNRSKEKGGRHLLEFYLNLYERPPLQGGQQTPPAL